MSEKRKNELISSVKLIINSADGFKLENDDAIEREQIHLQGMIHSVVGYNSGMKKRPYRKPVIPITTWTTEQDCYLIEHSLQTNDELAKILPYTADEINERKDILGLIRRNRQLRRFDY